MIRAWPAPELFVVIRASYAHGGSVRTPGGRTAEYDVCIVVLISGDSALRPSSGTGTVVRTGTVRRLTVLCFSSVGFERDSYAVV